MATIATWGNHKFVVEPSVIQSFTDLKIKGHCNTEDKNNESKEFVTRKSGKPTEISLTVQLNALTGVKDVYGEAMLYVQEADEGKTDYLYLGPSKVLDIKLMLVTAEVQEVIFFPGSGNIWISCSVKLTLKKASKKDGSGSGGSGGKNGYSARVYYSASSGATSSVTAWSSVSYADALKKAYAKVPKNAQWASTKAKQATNQSPALTTAALEAARNRAAKASETKIQTAGLNKYKNNKTILKQDNQ